jgi:large conductance mechanosensitive channel
MLAEFKKFAVRGNVIDLAIGVIIGGAFGAVVKSIVDDVLMPPIGLLTGGVDFGNKFVVLKEGARQAGPYASLEMASSAGATVLRYGAFLNTLVTFLIVAWVVFLLVRAINRLQPPPAPAATKECPRCLTAVAERATRCPACTSDI